MKKVSYRDEILKYVNFNIPQKYIDMIDKLACEQTHGNRTQMFIKLIEMENKQKKLTARKNNQA